MRPPDAGNVSRSAGPRRTGENISCHLPVDLLAVGRPIIADAVSKGAPTAGPERTSFPLPRDEVQAGLCPEPLPFAARVPDAYRGGCCSCESKLESRGGTSRSVEICRHGLGADPPVRFSHTAVMPTLVAPR